jgi:AraC-like DNA-binding protein
MIKIEQKYYLPDIGYFISRKCTQNWKMKEHEISFIDITYITEGSATYVINGISYNVQSGDLLCLPPGSFRSAVSDPVNLMSCYSVNFLLQNMQGEILQLPFPLFSHIDLRSDIVGLFRELSGIWLRKESGYFMKSQAIFILILHKLFELIVYKVDTHLMDPRIKKAINYISEYYSENMSVAQLAAYVKLKPVYFGVLFKKMTGMTLNNYLTQIRINHAENMLCSGDCTIGEIAERCGYNDIHYFRKQFKSIFGYPPSQYISHKSFFLFETGTSQTASTPGIFNL